MASALGSSKGVLQEALLALRRERLQLLLGLLQELIEYMARAIVDNPDSVSVLEEDAGDHIVYHLQVADDDMGRVIGKQGRIANAMRTLLKVAAIRQGARAVLEIGQ